MDKKISLEHAIKNIVRESIGAVGTDKFKGTQPAFLKPIPPIEPPKGAEHPDGASAVAKRGAAKIKQSETMKEEEELSEAGGVNLKNAPKQKPLTAKEKTGISNLPGDIDAAVRGAASSATFGAADHIAAAGDYAVKNIGAKLGIGQGTTYEKEYKQEQEKTAKAQKEHPTAYTAGEWAPLVAGGVKAGVSAAKGLYGAAKAAPETIKSFSKWYGKTSPIDTLKAGLRSAGGDIISNPVKYAKEIPSTATGMAKFGAGLEIADKSVGMPELVGGQGWKQGAIYDSKKRKEMFSPGGGTKTIQDVGKAGAEMAAPGSVEAGKAAVKGDWDKAGKEATKAVVGATLVNPNLGRFVYDAAASAIAPQYSLTGEGGVSDRIYNKIKKIKESKENLNEGNPAFKELFGGLSKAVADKLAREAAAKAAKAAAEAAAKAKDAKTNIVHPEFPSAGAAKPAPKPKKAPPQTEPGREGTPVRRDNDNVPGKVVPIRKEPQPVWPPSYKPGKDMPNMPPPANPSPGAPKVPEFKPPPDMPPPANPEVPKPIEVKPPKEKPAAPVKKPEPVSPERREAPTREKPVETKPKVTPTEVPALPVDPRINPKFLPGNRPAPAPAPAPVTRPVPVTQPAPAPAHVTQPVPVAKPLPTERKRPDDDAVVVPKPETAKDKGKKPDESGTGKREPEGGKPPRKRRLPFGLGLPSISPGVLAGLRGFVPVTPYVHHADPYIREDNEADTVRKSIENVARPGGKTRIAKQGEIKTKIIDENAKRADIIRQTIADKKSTVVLKPKLKHPELDEN